MMDYKRRFDIFICGGAAHVPRLKPLLGRLQPYGTVHLASCFLSDCDLQHLRGLYDVLHAPRHSPDGYHNFELFCLRDINRLAAAPYFIKLDADVELAPDWISYVEESLAAYPDVVLFGPRRGDIDVNFEISGALVRQLLESDIHVTNGRKVIGGFYVGQTAFFKEHRRLMDIVHELIWCYRDGVRVRPSINPAYWPPEALASREPLKVVGGSPRFEGNEDTVRSLVVHAAGAGERLHVLESGGRVVIRREH